MSELTNKVVTKHEIRGEVQITKVYPELENLTVTPTKAIQSFNHPDSYGYNNVMVKAIDCEPLSVVPQKEDQTFDGMYDKVTVKAIKCDTLNVTPKKESQSFDGMYDKVNVDAIVGETLNVTPSKKAQIFNGLYETVNVEEMHGDTLSITPMETTQTFNGIYENVSVDKINTEEVTIDLDFSSKDKIEVSNTTGKYITKATVNKPVTLKPENIKSGENICGVVGTYETKLTTDNPIDISNTVGTVEVKIDGKNKFNQEDWYSKLRAVSTVGMQKRTVDGIEYFRVNPAYISDYQYMKGMFKENTQYAISWKGRAESFINGTITGFKFMYTDGTRSYRSMDQTLIDTDYELISEEGKTIDYIDMTWGYGEYALMRDIQLVEGTEVSSYTKFKDGQTYTFDIEDGDSFEIALS